MIYLSGLEFFLLFVCLFWILFFFADTFYVFRAINICRLHCSSCFNPFCLGLYFQLCCRFFNVINETVALEIQHFNETKVMNVCQ